MALRFYDSFDLYIDLPHTLQRWTSYGGNSPDWGAYGRFGTYGFRCSDNSAYISKTLDSQQTWTIGFSFMRDEVGSPGGAIAHIYDDATSQVYLYINAAGKIEIRRGDHTVLATGTRTISPDVQYHIQFKVTIHNSTGSAEVRVDGNTDSSVSGADTQNSGNATANIITLGELIAAYYMFSRYDDVYMCDGTGGSPYDTFLGDCRIECKLPDGNGNSSQLVGSDSNSTDNYLLVDESPGSDGDTTFVESSTVGNKDTYTYGNVTPTTGTVHAVQIVPYTRKTDAGTRSIATVARLSGTEVDSSNLTLASSYELQTDIRLTRPGGGSWSITDVNSAEFGVKITA